MPPSAPDYDLAPLMLYWEVTRACDLACRHCRAEAIPWRDARELSTTEGRHLLDAVAGFGERIPHLVLTGGDPLRRPDLEALVAHAVRRGITTSVTPSGTPACTPEALRRLRLAGATGVAFSIDGSSAERHDDVRRVRGSFERTCNAVGWALELGLAVQVNTLVSAETASDLPAIEALVRALGAQRWALFFLIQVGRGSVLREVTPEAGEEILKWVCDRAREPGLVIKATEAHHVRRLAAQHADGHERTSNRDTAIRRGWAIRDGGGIMFISHVGDVYPSGFLPIRVGNMRRDDPVALYRHAPLFRALRDPGNFRGKCGACEFRFICGGSRARAYAATGDPLESDPLCVYQPRSGAAPGGSIDESGSGQVRATQAGAETAG